MERRCCVSKRFETAQKHSTYVGRETKEIAALRSVLVLTPQYGPAIRLKRDTQLMSFLSSDKRCRQKVMALSRVMPRYVGLEQNAKVEPLTGLGAYPSLSRGRDRGSRHGRCRYEFQSILLRCAASVSMSWLKVSFGVSQYLV